MFSVTLFHDSSYAKAWIGTGDQQRYDGQSGELAACYDHSLPLSGMPARLAVTVSVSEGRPGGASIRHPGPAGSTGS